MWKCDYNEEDNLTITFMLPLSSPEKLCKIVVWNYNRHLQVRSAMTKNIFMDFFKALWLKM